MPLVLQVVHTPCPNDLDWIILKNNASNILLSRPKLKRLRCFTLRLQDWIYIALFAHEVSQTLNTPLSPDLNSPFNQTNGSPRCTITQVQTRWPLSHSPPCTPQTSQDITIYLYHRCFRLLCLIKMGMGLSSFNFHCILCQQELESLRDPERGRLKETVGSVWPGAGSAPSQPHW